MAKIFHYYHTLRYLRPGQVYSRVKLRLHRPPPDLRPAPVVRQPTKAWRGTAFHPPCMAGPREFRFLNVAGELVDDNAWQTQDAAAGIDRLWLYNLHYFDDLTAADSGARREWHTSLIQHWIAANPPGHGVGWEPYPVSRRIVNWVKSSWHGGTLDEAAVQSLAVQARWLARRLEYHLLGNHLLANAKALVFAGLFFAGPEAEAWLRRGLEIFAEQLPEQVLSDGGHYERSTMYHAVVLEDLLDVYQALATSRDALPAEGHRALQSWPALLEKMQSWLWTMTHPDGDIGLFNDAALGIAATPGQLDSYARELGLSSVPRPGPGLTRLDASGYMRLELGPAVLLLDVAPLGPDYLPGHAHADTLSFEMSLFGQRFIVHSGTSTYREGPQREYERSTAAHNTVEIGGQSSSEMWGAFRVARRARAKVLEVTQPNDGWLVSAEHDGYRRLASNTNHQRTYVLYPHDLRVLDSFDRPENRPVARVHLHPNVTYHGVGPAQRSLDPSPFNADEHRFAVAGRPVRCGGMLGVVSTTPSEYHPQFGVTQTNLCLEWRPTLAYSLCMFEWNES